MVSLEGGSFSVATVTNGRGDVDDMMSEWCGEKEECCREDVTGSTTINAIAATS